MDTRHLACTRSNTAFPHSVKLHKIHDKKSNLMSQLRFELKMEEIIMDRCFDLLGNVCIVTFMSSMVVSNANTELLPAIGSSPCNCEHTMMQRGVNFMVDERNKNLLLVVDMIERDRERDDCCLNICTRNPQKHAIHMQVIKYVVLLVIL
ncbi:uncharacterized protein LOC113302048 isoform X1 [Papaver somniferum]|nr:uncharacterized protein LOC113302048 isoform X1 [Papaver somniferum]